MPSTIDVQPAQRAQNARTARQAEIDRITPYTFAGGVVWKLNLSSARCVCGGCQDGFNSLAAFDRHQRLRTDGRPVCLDPASLGMVRNEAGWWVTELRPAATLPGREGH